MEGSVPASRILRTSQCRRTKFPARAGGQLKLTTAAVFIYSVEPDATRVEAASSLFELELSAVARVPPSERRHLAVLVSTGGSVAHNSEGFYRLAHNPGLRLHGSQEGLGVPPGRDQRSVEPSPQVHLPPARDGRRRWGRA